MMMELDLFLNVLTVLEVIAVEFASIWNFSEKKHSFKASLGLYIVITAILLLFMCTVATKLPGYGNGNGRFMTLGVFYFIPAMINYGGDKKSRIIIAFYSFSYGLAIFAAAVRISYLFDSASFAKAALISLTLLYAATFPLYLHFSKDRLMVYLQKASTFQKNLLTQYTIASFFLIILYNNVLVSGANMFVKLALYVLLLYFIVLTYRLIVSYLKADDDIKEQTELARTDRLTGLGNRLALKQALEERVKNNEAFYLMFMDLNDFKSINDRYGHAAGDVYLQQFAGMLKQHAKAENCFRFAGDEFICLTTDASLGQTIHCLSINRLGKAEYLGVSVGMAKYPDETDDISGLLELADKRMYKQKMADPRAKAFTVIK